MKIKKLVKDIPDCIIKGKDVEITGICSNSKVVAPGNLFVAKKGHADDGSKYINEALSAGAVAILTDIFDPSLGVSQIIHPKVVEAEGAIAANYYRFPGKELFAVGITGTNGKTTTSYIIKYLFDYLSATTGLIGTIEYIMGKTRYQATRTTPDVVSNQKMLREMLNQGCKSVVMEVTSHALEQGRVQNIDFDVAIFTNLTLDHLDYHQTMENYCAAKNKLFRSLGKNGTAVINVDSPWCDKIKEGCQGKILTYSINCPSDLQAADIELSAEGTTFNLLYKLKTYKCKWPLVGRFNVYNYLVAVAAGLSKGFEVEKMIQTLSTFPAVPGRLETVPNDLNLKIYVDYAHTDDALINVLESLTEFKKGKIYTVFGCGGERDHTKRPKMAAAAERFSDLCFLTTDNCRSEDPQTIANEVAKGFKNSSSYTVELDRKLAIEKAIQIATPNDIILIAGKGHETYQIFAHKTIEFDDKKVAGQICKQLQPVNP